MKRAENSRYTVLKTNFIFTLFLGGFTVVNMAIAICLKLISFNGDIVLYYI